MGTTPVYRSALFIALLAIAPVLALAGDGPTGSPTTAPATPPPPATARQPAVVVSLSGVIDDYNRDATFKRFAEARRLGAKVVILKLNTTGGLVTAGLDISRFLKQQDDLHIIAFVNNQAYSAGIMIGMACDEIVMEPGSYIGDSAPIVMDSSGGLMKLEGAERAKQESPILADFHDSAVKNGHDPVLAEAMVSYGRIVRWIEYTGAPSTTRPAGERRFVSEEQFAKLAQEGWSEVNEPGVPRPLDAADTLLTVSADVAHTIGLASAISPSPQALAADRGYTIVAELAPGGGEKLVALLSGAVVRGLLLTIFMLSLYAALHTPGTGGAEAIALSSLGLLVGIPLLTGYAQWWEILLIIVGLCLIAVELFLIPGFGIAGISGLALFLGGLIMTFVGNTPGLPGTWRLPQIWSGLQNGMLAVVIAFATSGLLALWLRKFLPKLPYLNRLVLQPSSTVATAGGGAVAGVGASGSTDAWPFVGTVGRAVTDLRPGGSAEFPYADDRRITPVVSDSGFAPAGAKLVVREVEGNHVVVRPVP